MPFAVLCVVTGGSKPGLEGSILSREQRREDEEAQARDEQEPNERVEARAHLPATAAETAKASY